MSQRTSIEWTNRSWNPTRGCTRVSEGCRNCYAERQAARQCGDGRPYHGLVKLTKAGPRWTGEVALVYENLEDPLSWRAPQLVFVDSMSDLFHEKVPDEYIALVFAVMAAAPRHTFQILTKRPERMRTLLSYEAFWGYVTLQGMERFWGLRELAMLDLGVASPLPNVWLGTSVENQAAADERIPQLIETPAAVRFLSCEPLLGPVEIGDEALDRLHWVIAGGESGPRARPIDVEWAHDLRAQCGFAGVPFFMKQASGPRPGMQGELPDDLWLTKEMPGVPVTSGPEKVGDIVPRVLAAIERGQR